MLRDVTIPETICPAQVPGAIHKDLLALNMDSTSHLTPRHPRILYITAGQFAEMLAHVQHLLPEEACGMLGGVIQGEAYYARMIINVTNALHSPSRYRMEPKEQLAAFETIDAQDLQLVGIYHSHPSSALQPSPRDIAEAYYPEAVYLIWSRLAGKWECRAYAIQAGVVTMVDLHVTAENF